MTPAEKRKQKEERAKLKVYRSRLMDLKDVVPNTAELMEDNKKLLEFFEGGKGQKFEGQVTIKPSNPIEKVNKEKKIQNGLTVEIYKELKANGLNDRTIMADYGLYPNKLTAWKKANGLDKLSLESGRGPRKEAVAKPEKAVEVDQTKEKTNELSEKLIESQKFIDSAKAVIKMREIEIEKLKAKEAILIEQLLLAQKAEKQALDELIQYQAEYRNLEVDYRNQSTEQVRLKEMLEKLKHTSQINVWLMKQHIGFVEQADLMAGGEN